MNCALLILLPLLERGKHSHTAPASSLDRIYIPPTGAEGSGKPDSTGCMGAWARVHSPSFAVYVKAMSDHAARDQGAQL